MYGTFIISDSNLKHTKLTSKGLNVFLQGGGAEGANFHVVLAVASFN